MFAQCLSRNAVSFNRSHVRQSHYLVMVRDHANSLEKRMEVRPKHLDRAKVAYDQGILRAGGALLNEPIQIPVEGLTLNSKSNQLVEDRMTGSTFILELPSQEICYQWLKDDPYAKGGVWNLKSVYVQKILLAKH